MNGNAVTENTKTSEYKPGDIVNSLITESIYLGALKTRFSAEYDFSEGYKIYIHKEPRVTHIFKDRKYGCIKEKASKPEYTIIGHEESFPSLQEAINSEYSYGSDYNKLIKLSYFFEGTDEELISTIRTLLTQDDTQYKKIAVKIINGNIAARITESMTRKAKLVNGINNLVRQGLLSGVQSVQYELLCYKDYYPQEVIKVIYPGDGFCVRNNSGNSEGETLRTIAGLVYGGYYTEVPWYEDILKRASQENPEWTVVKMEDILEMEPEEI